MKDDRELVAEALEGGLEAFGEIVDRYRDAVFGVSLARLRNFHDAEDVAQTVFVEAFGKLDNFKEPMNLGAWLRTIAIRRSIDLIRTKKESVGTDGVEREEAETDGTDLREQVLEAIGKLGKTQRETVSLYYINGYTIDEVATMQGSPAGTVKRRLHEARKKLKEEMMKTVEGVLKSEAPKEDFGERIFGLLNQYPKMTGADSAIVRDELEKTGIPGIDGLIKALESQHAPTRYVTMGMIDELWDTVSGEDRTKALLIEMLKNATRDSNKKVRARAAGTLLWDGLGVEEERMRNEFLPLVTELLNDRSRKVRAQVAGNLRRRSEWVPLATVIRALDREKDWLVRLWLRELKKDILAVKGD